MGHGLGPNGVVQFFLGSPICAVYATSDYMQRRIDQTGSEEWNSRTAVDVDFYCTVSTTGSMDTASEDLIDW